MKQELIAELFQRFEEACYLYAENECWSARDLQEILGYAKWDNFKTLLKRRKPLVKMREFLS
jgi:DNA-damage-inducible protein D